MKVRNTRRAYVTCQKHTTKGRAHSLSALKCQTKKEQAKEERKKRGQKDPTQLNERWKDMKGLGTRAMRDVHVPYIRLAARTMKESYRRWS